MQTGSLKLSCRLAETDDADVPISSQCGESFRLETGPYRRQQRFESLPFFIAVFTAKKQNHAVFWQSQRAPCKLFFSRLENAGIQ